MLWLEEKYIGLVGYKLQGLVKRNGTYNFRCPYCGDSKKSKTKKRGFLLRSKSGASHTYYCHNCNIVGPSGKNINFHQFLKFLDPALYNQFMEELLRERYTTAVEQDETPEEPYVDKTLKSLGLKKISQLYPTHPAKLYVEKRKIPSHVHHKLFYVSKFMAWTNTLVSGKFDEKALAKDTPRLVIPFIDQDGRFFGYQGRSFDPADKVRYITIIIDDKKPKLYGLDTVDLSKRVYVFEGPIDAMFIPNSLASAGGVLTSELRSLGPPEQDDKVIVYDNENRNKDTVSHIKKAIGLGYRVCIWPDNLDYKDVNDMVLAGLDPKEIIDKNLYIGLHALARFNEWKKV